MAETTAATVGVDDLQRFAAAVLEAAGLPRAGAEIVAENLMTANRSGVDSHGVVRLAHYVRRIENGTIKANPKVEFEKLRAGAGIVDGDDGFGQVVTSAACDHAMTLARETGCATVAIRNSSHFGMAGYYALKLAAEGFASMVMTPSDAFLVPFGAKRSFFGTNPVAFGFPTEGIPVVLDMATVSIPYGKIALAQVEGRSIPPEWGVDADGNPTTDPNSVVGLHPVAGPKGSGIAMVIDIFCTLFTGMAFGPHITKMYGELDKKRGLGHFIAAWDISTFLPLESFTGRLRQMIDELHDLPKADGFDRIFYPGELEGSRRATRDAEGVPLDTGLIAELTELGSRFDIAFPGS